MAGDLNGEPGAGGSQTSPTRELGVFYTIQFILREFPQYCY